MDLSYSPAIDHSSAAAKVAETYSSAHKFFPEAVKNNPDVDLSPEGISLLAEHVGKMFTPKAMFSGVDDKNISSAHDTDKAGSFTLRPSDTDIARFVETYQRG